jgi:Cu(I)/Ag(I) efflux system membrane protein CusA/SilA
VAIISLPLGILAAFLVMRWQGINANIMSLGGIAIAIGAMVDAAVVMIENAHKKLEAWQHATPTAWSARNAGGGHRGRGGSRARRCSSRC